MNPTKDYSRLARALEEDLRAQMASVDHDLAEVQPLLQVAELLGNQAIRAELSDDVQRLTARHEALRQAARILQARQPRDGPGAAAPLDTAAAGTRPTAAGAWTSPVKPASPATAGEQPTVSRPTEQSSTQAPAWTSPEPVRQESPRAASSAAATLEASAAETIPADAGSDGFAAVDSDEAEVLEQAAAEDSSAAAAPEPAPAAAEPQEASREELSDDESRPRPLEELEVEREAVAVAVQGLQGPGKPALARFKREVARFQGAYMERLTHPEPPNEWQRLLAALQQLKDRHWPRHYCLPLAELPGFGPAEWRELARHYARLGQAEESLDMLERAYARKSKSWLSRHGGPLAESIGAVAALMDDWLRRRLPQGYDPQLNDLIGRTRELGVPLRSLSLTNRPAESELQAMAGSLDERLIEMRQLVEQR